MWVCMCVCVALALPDGYHPVIVCVYACVRGREGEIENFIRRQPPMGGKDDYDSENSWISDGLPSSKQERERAREQKSERGSARKQQGERARARTRDMEREKENDADFLNFLVLDRWCVGISGYGWVDVDSAPLPLPTMPVSDLAYQAPTLGKKQRQ